MAGGSRLDAGQVRGDRVSWLRIDDSFAEHEKIIDLSDKAFRLHIVGMCYCARNLTDGRLTDRAIKVVCAVTSASRRHIVELRDATLWVPLEDGWQIKDYLDYNPDAAAVKGRRAMAADRQRRWRDSRRGPDGRFNNTTPNPSPNALRNAAPSPTPIKPYVCDQPLCGIAFPTRQRLQDHLANVHHIIAA